MGWCSPIASARGCANSTRSSTTRPALPIRYLAGGLISEAARSAGAKLINGEGERFVDELQPRDVVASAILRECAEGRGIERDGQLGVFLDTPTLEKKTRASSRSAS